MKNSVLILFFLSITGCATYQYKNGQSLGHPVFSPAQETSFYGQLHAEPLADYLFVMQEECSKINRKLDSTDIQTVYTNFIGEKIYKYSCIERPQNTSLPLRQNSYQSNTEVGTVDPIEPQAKPITSNSDIKTSSKLVPVDMTSAKSKCTDLGFKAKTEKFGKCVLELTR